jgi:hypothetical protein
MNSVNISFGDRVSICCERVNAFLCSTGVADVRVHLTEQSLPGKHHANFDRCIFSIEKLRAWGTATIGGNASTKATGEGGTNGLPSSSSTGMVDPLMFGNVIQLRHVYSGHYLAVTRNRRPNARGSLYVALETLSADNYPATHFRVMPRYKIRQEGERVGGGDHLVFFNEYLKVHLSLDTACEELIGSATLEPFSLCMFDSAEMRLASSTIRMQSSILLFHKEQESFFQLEPPAPGSAAASPPSGSDGMHVPSLVHPHIRDSTYNIAALDFSANALWVLEGTLGSEGGAIVASHDAYRIKHCALGQYLAASLTNQNQLILVDQPLEGDASLWVFVPCDVTERLIQTSNTFFRLQNATTGWWIHTAPTSQLSNPSDSSPLQLAHCGSIATLSMPDTTNNLGAKASRYLGHMSSAAAAHARDTVEPHVDGLLSLVERPAYVDVFCAVTAPYVVERDLHRVLGYWSLLRQLRHVAATSSANSLASFVDNPLISKVKVCLVELVPFCFEIASSTGATSSSTSAPMGASITSQIPGGSLTETSTLPQICDRPLSSSPDPARQRMLLDQKLHKLVMDTLDHLLRFEHQWPQYPPLMTVVHLMFRFLSAVIKENPRGCEDIGASINRLTPYLIHLPSACDVFVQVTRINALDSTLVGHIANLCIPLLSTNDAYFILLQELCFGGGVPCPENQVVIFDSINAAEASPQIIPIDRKMYIKCPDMVPTENGQRDEKIPIEALQDAFMPALRYCAGAWKLLGCCTVGRPYPTRAWVEVDFLPQLMATARHPLLQQAIICVARSIFLADVECDLEEQHHQLWSWKYKMGEPGSPAGRASNASVGSQITDIQQVIMRETIEMLQPLCDSMTGASGQPSAFAVPTSYSVSTTWLSQCDLLNELLVLWNSIAISQCFTPEHAERLSGFVGKFMESPPFGAQLSTLGADAADRALQSVFHVLNLISRLLEDHCASAAQEVRHMIRPQLHEETGEDIIAIADDVRSKSFSQLLCRREWLPRMLEFAGTKNRFVASAALSCMFSILSPARLALEHLQASVVFSEGFERILGRLLVIAQHAAGKKFLAGRPTASFENALIEVIDMTSALTTDLTTTLDAQNVLHFVGIHSAICQFLDDAQRASYTTSTVGGVVEFGMQVLAFMTERNPDNATAMVAHLATLTQLSTLCQTTLDYYTVMERTFESVDEDTVVDVTKLVHDIFGSEHLSEPPLRVVLQALRCKSNAVQTNAREATVSAMSVISFESIEPSCKSMILEIVCECIGPDTWDALSRYLTVADVMTVTPSSSSFLMSSSSDVRDAFAVSVRCVTHLFLREGATMATEDVDLMKHVIVDSILDIASTNQQLQNLPAVAFECLSRLIKIDGYRHLFLTPVRAIAAHVLNHCETSVNTKFQLESKDELLEFFDGVEEFVKPDSLPNIAVVRRRLQRISKHADILGTGSSASSISGHWAKIRGELTLALREPRNEELVPLTTLLSSGSIEARERMRLFVNHLRHSDLQSWVAVDLLMCLNELLTNSKDDSERALLRMQDDLNLVGATPLLSTLLEKPDFNVVRHAIKFGISLLDEGNKRCQDTLLNYFKTHDEKFFLTIRKYLKLAQTDIIYKSPAKEPDSELDEQSFAAMSQDLCRLLQLLCEGHHFEFQNYVRHQNDNFNSYNMCILVMELLHTVVGKMDPATLPVAVQALNTLTEFCQGPCQQNQGTIVGCNIVAEVNRILTMMYPEEQFNEDVVKEIKQAAIVLLLALLEGSQDSSIANLLLTHIDVTALHTLVEQVWCDAFKKGMAKADSDELLELGFNIFILAKILVANGDKVKGEKLACIIRDTAGYDYFNASICNIEIWRDDDPASLRLETVYFRKPEICSLREETKEQVMSEVDRSSLVSKHSDFCKYADDLIFEMEFQFQIEESSREIPRIVRFLTFNLMTCRPRPVEDLLLLFGLTSNMLVIMGFTTREGPINWVASVVFATVGFFQMCCAVYLVVVRLVLKLPRLAHKSLKKGQEDPFLNLKTWREKFVHVASFSRIRKVAQETYTVAFTVFAVASLLSIVVSPYFNTFLLGMVTFKAPLLANIVSAITMNGRQLLLTAFLGVISVYFFTVIGFLFFHEHFEREGGGSNCDSLLQCFFYTFGQGVRGGGGIGDEIKTNHWEDHDFFPREIYDTLFFVMVAVIVMNIVFALIVDTFAELRDARKTIEDDMRTTCFVCGIDAATFDREGEGFGPHTKGPHNVWQYLYFLHHLRRKEVCEYTGQESYVASKMTRLDLSFFPVNRSKSLQKVHVPQASGEDDAGAQGAEGGVSSGPSLDEFKKAMKEIMEEHTKSLKANAPSTSSTSTSAPTRATMLWAKARSARSSIVHRGPNASFVGGLTNSSITSQDGLAATTVVNSRVGGNDDDETQHITLAPSIQAVSRARSTIASINELLDSTRRGS